MHAIPTKWRGVQFRSRLEARWAAFFTAVGWEWSYEPIDLRGYIPDFILHMHEDVLVEVKPFTRSDDPAMLDAAHKAEEGGWLGRGVVVGARLFEASSWGAHPTINAIVIGLAFKDYDRHPAALGVCTSCNKPAISTTTCHCEVCGEPGFMGFHSIDRIEVRRRVFEAWDEAGNVVQWKGRP